MKYYVVVISTGDSKIEGKAVYEYDTQTEAVATFHKKLGTAMSSELYTSELVVVLDSYGTTVKREYYTVPVDTTEEEVATEETETVAE